MPDGVMGSSRVHVIAGTIWRKYTVHVTGRRRSHNADILLGRASTVGAVARQGSRAGHWVARGRCREDRCPERQMRTKEPDEGDGAGPGSVGSVGRHGGEGDSPKTRERYLELRIPNPVPVSSGNDIRPVGTPSRWS